MTAHIELNRKFWAITDKDDVDPDSTRYLHLWSRDTQPGWPELLQMHRVVVLAEAGTGKSQEFKETARRLHAEGKAAFFCAIEELAEVGIEASFDVGSYSEFREWLATDHPGWFFLDSFDEARLVKYEYFNRALKRLSQELGNSLDRTSIYISGRGSDWNTDSDLELIKDRLTPTRKQLSEVSKEPSLSTPAIIKESTKNNDDKYTVQIFRLAPLSTDQTQHFAQFRGTPDAVRFVEAIKRADAGIFAERPRDLIDLIDFWKSYGNIASLEEMTEFNIKKKLTENNPKHGKYNPLSPSKARAGAEIVAAALTFSRCNFIALPDPQLHITTSVHALDVKELLPGWQPKEVESLLRRALFDEATYGRARIHHRSVREYLTAQWLHKLLQQNKSRRNVEQWLFAERYGLEVVIPSMKPVAAWLALWDDKVRQRLCDIAPEILIGYGDPSRLPIPVREELLRKFAAVSASNRYYDESLDISAVRRLADSRLATTTNRLLEEYRQNEEVRQLLLRTIWQGAIQECAESALSFALDPSMDGYTRLTGIRALEVCGNTEQQRRIVSAILRDAVTGDVKLTSAVIEQFFPQLITVDVLLETLEKLPKPKRFSISPAAHALEQIVERNSDKNLLPLLAGMVRLLEFEPHIDNYCEISKRYAWLLPHAGNIALLYLRRSTDHYDEPVLRTTELVAISRDYGDDNYRTPKTDLQTVIDDTPALRHLLFWRAVERKRKKLQEKQERLNDWWQIGFSLVPRKNVADFEYFLTQAQLQADPENRLIAYSMALSLWHDGGRDATKLEQLQAIAKFDNGKAVKLDAYVNPPPDSPDTLEHEREMREIEARHMEEKRQEQLRRESWINRLQTDPLQLRDISKATLNKKFPDLYYLARTIQRLEANGPSRWGVNKWEVLIEEFGHGVAVAARDGLMAYWRLYTPAIKRDSSVPNGLIVGLVGLAIEARTKPEWAQQLTNQEVLLAARYAR